MIKESSFYWCAPHETPQPGWHRVGDDDFRETITASPDSPAGPAPPWAWDLACVARVVYLADKKAPRSRAKDRWTRIINVSIPLANPDAWTGKATDLLHQLLNTLTADTWRITLRQGDAAWTHGTQNRLFDTWQASEVALLSGGLDSTSWAAHRARSPGGPLRLVTYRQIGQEEIQNQVIKQVSDLKLRQVRPQVRALTALGRRGADPLDLTARSRGLLFTATAVLEAATHSVETVDVPENGQLALNPPLTASRVAACSTRSVHPYTLDLVNRLIRAVDGTVAVNNPLRHMTKADVCRLGRDAGLSPDVLHATVSCARPQVNHGGATHCGYCYPCLIRRTGLGHALGEDDRTTYYSVHPWTLRPGDTRTTDFRALQRWLSAPYTVHDLIADMPLPEEIAPRDLMPVIRRGRREIATAIDAVLPRNSDFRHGWTPSP